MTPEEWTDRRLSRLAAEADRLRQALLAARSVISGDEGEHPANDWWGVMIARRHLAALLAAVERDAGTDAGRETEEPDSALDPDAVVDAALQGRARPCSRLDATSSPPRMTTDDVGGYYVHDDGSIWQLVGFSDRPTATLERVNKDDGPQRRGGVVGAPIFEGFRKLVPEDPE